MTKNIKLCQALAHKLRAAGQSEPEIRRAVDAYERKLDQEDEAETGERYAPKGTSARDLAKTNFERIFEGKAPLLQDPSLRPDLHRDLTEQQIASLNLERAVYGEEPLGAKDIAEINVKRVRDAGPSVEQAPRGMHKTMLARENLRRACSGLPAMVPHEDDQE